MKYLTILLFSVSCFAQVDLRNAELGNAVLGTGGGGGGGCTTITDSQVGTSTGAYGLGQDSGATYSYSTYTNLSGDSTSPCGVELGLLKTGSPNYTIAVAMYTEDGTGKPNAIIGSWSSEYNVSALTGTEQWIKFTLNTGQTVPQRYCIVVRSTGSPNNSTDYATWSKYSISTTPNSFNQVGYSASGSSWNVYDSSTEYRYRLYK